MDHLTKEQRHKNMIANKSKGTKIELLLGKMLWNAGVRYRKNDSSLPGTPDFSIKRFKIAIFCDGEFWHGHNWEERKNDIKTNRDFWYAKIERNIQRDTEVSQKLMNMGWKVFRFWENDIRHNPDLCLRDILDYIQTIKCNGITPEETYGSACSSMNIYGPHSFNRDGSIMSVNDQMAVVSHYLHNHGNSYAEPFEDLADGLIEDILEDNDEQGNINEDMQHTLFNSTFSATFPPPLHTKFTFIDLFAGIGGMRLAAQQLGGRCAYASEWDADAAKQYFSNFGEAPFGDITKEENKNYIPRDFDILCASMPLQAFTLSHRRNNFEKIRGTLFNEVSDIISRREPKAIVLELPGNENIEDLNIITSMLHNELGYSFTDMCVFDTADFSLPHHRNYLYIVAFRDDITTGKFIFPRTLSRVNTFKDIMEDTTVSARYYLTAKAAENIEARRIIDADEIPVINGNSVLIDNRTTDIMPSTTKLDKLNRIGLRHLTQREYARIQGFPDAYSIRVNNRTATRLLLASTPVTLAKEVIKSVMECLELKEHKFKYGK